MKINELYSLLDNMFPVKDAEIWDNVGFYKKKYKNKLIDSVLVSLDISLKVVQYAIKNNVNLIISHHPIFINRKERKAEHIVKIDNLLNKHKISIISLHTNYDKNKFGMNYQISNKLKGNIINKAFKTSYGNLIHYKKPIKNYEIKNIIKNNLKADFIIEDKTVIKKDYKKIYVCGGSGSSEIERLININNGIDCFISSEIKWNLWNFANSKNIKIFDIGHNVENIFVEHFYQIIKKEGIKVIKMDKIKLSIN